MHNPQNLRWRVAQSLEWRWWRRYLRGKSVADYLADKERYWHRILRELDWDIRPGARVADLGCGPAGIFIALHRRQRVTALDPLLERYDDLAVFDRSAYPTVDFLCRRLESVHDLSPFDQLYCFNAINHVADWEAGLDRLTELSRPGTELLISSDVHRHAWLLPVFRALPGDALHPQQHRAEDYRRALRARGWRIDLERVLRREAIFNYHAWKCTRL